MNSYNTLIYTAILFLCCSCRTDSTSREQDGKSIIVTGRIEPFRQGDTIKLKLWKYVASKLRKAQVPHETFLATNPDGSFSFKVLARDGAVRYMSLASENFLTKEDPDFVSVSLYPYIIFPGDSVHIKVIRDRGKILMRNGKVAVTSTLRVDTVLFSGEASGLFACQYAMKEARYHISDSLRVRYANKHLLVDGQKCYGLKYISYYDEYFDGVAQSKLSVLDDYRLKISDKAYSILKNNIISRSAVGKQKSFNTALSNLAYYIQSEKISKIGRKLLASERKKVMTSYNTLSRNPPGLDTTSLAISIDYLDYLWARIHFRYKYIDQSVSPLDHIIETTKGKIRGALVTEYLLERGRRLPSKEALLEKSKQYIENTEIINSLEDFLLATETGEPAYDFELEDANGKIHRLSDYYGKVIFMDFWYEGCGGCKGYYQRELSAVEEIFEENSSVVFISISIDRTKKEFLEAIESGHYTAPRQKNVINLNTGTLGQLHPVITQNNVVSYPWPMLIDKNGKIVTEGNILRKKESLIKHIQALL